MQNFLEAVNQTYSHLFLVLDISKKKKIYQYKYLGITDIISDLGGSFDIYVFLITIINKILSGFQYKSFLINSIFSFHYIKSTPKIIKAKRSISLINITPKGYSSLESKKSLVSDLVKDYLNSMEKVYITPNDIILSNMRQITRSMTKQDKIKKNV